MVDFSEVMDALNDPIEEDKGVLFVMTKKQFLVFSGLLSALIEYWERTGEPPPRILWRDTGKLVYPPEKDSRENLPDDMTKDSAANKVRKFTDSIFLPVFSVKRFLFLLAGLVFGYMASKVIANL